MGKKTIQVWRMSSHSMGRCHVLWFSFFVLTIDHLSSSISSFLKFVPVCRLYLERPSRADGFSSYLAVDHRKWEPCGNEFSFQWVLLVFPFYESTSFFPLVSHRHSFTRLSLFNCTSLREPSTGTQNHQSSVFKIIFISLMSTFSLFPSMFFHDILFWLGFFPSV